VTSDPAPGSNDFPLPPPTVPYGQQAAPYGQPVYGPPSYGQAGYGQAGYGQSPYAPPPYSQPGMLAAQADRDRSMDVLKAAYGEGRLTKDEFDVRCGRVMMARTYGDLAGVVADLPAGPMGVVAPYQAGFYMPARVAPTNGLAIAALICGLAEMFTLGLAAIPAVILGHLARGQIKHTGERGDGMAIAGLVFGYLGIGIWTLVIIALAAHS
jgi:hypothetical protein